MKNKNIIPLNITNKISEKYPNICGIDMMKE